MFSEALGGREVEGGRPMPSPPRWPSGYRGRRAGKEHPRKNEGRRGGRVVNLVVSSSTDLDLDR